MTVAGFLNARLDEREALARRVQAVLDAGWNYFDETPTELIDPARVLREVEGIRNILSRYEDCLVRMEDPDYPHAVARDQAREYEDFVLPNIIAAWSDHPDYQQEWSA